MVVEFRNKRKFLLRAGYVISEKLKGCSVAAAKHQRGTLRQLEPDLLLDCQMPQARDVTGRPPIPLANRFREMQRRISFGLLFAIVASVAAAVDGTP